MLTPNDVNIDAEKQDTALAEKLAAEIALLKSKVTYSPMLRYAFIGGMVGAAAGGWIGAIGAAVLGGYFGSRVNIDETARQVIQNQISQLEKDLDIILQRGNISEQTINGIMSAKDLANFQYDTWAFTDKWEALFGRPAKAFHCMIFGRPKAGKSIFSVQFAKYLSDNFGKVLYVASEEGFSFTLQKKIREFGQSTKNLDFANFRDFESIRQALQDNVYSFVFIDSVNFIKIDPEQVEILKQENPHTAFITIQQATKEGQFRGSQEFAHNCDIIVQVEAGQASQQGRYQEPSTMQIFEPKEGEETEQKAQDGAPKRGRPRKKTAMSQMEAEDERDEFVHPLVFSPHYDARSGDGAEAEY